MPDTHGAGGRGWIGVDLDGTLAEYHGWQGSAHIGAPVPLMLERVHRWLGEGQPVKIMTARVAPGKSDAAECRTAIEAWLLKHLGCLVPITHEKDPLMLELWDDRVVQVVPNTGIRVDAQSASIRMAKALLYVVGYILRNQIRGHPTTTGDLSPFIVEQYLEAKKILPENERNEHSYYLKFCDAEHLERQAIDSARKSRGGIHFHPEKGNERREDDEW